jgi:hypothetical protein
MKQIICHTLFAHLPPSKNTRWKRLRRVVQAVAAFGAECQFPSGLQRIIVSKTSRLGSGTVSTLALLSIAIGQVALSQEPTWTERGPGRGREGPIVDNITEGITEALQTPLNLLPILGIVSRSNPASGAVNAIAFSSDANLLYAGTVNGGIWRANWPSSAQSPRSLGWTPLTDQMLPGLSINSLAISPSNPNRLFAGTGSTSSDVLDGSPGFGVARSTDGGSTWEVFASDTFAGKRINSIVPTGLNAAGNAAGMAGSDDEVVLAATWYGASKTDGGVYRSTDGGKTFTRMSDGSLQGLSLPPGSMSVGLPWGGVSSLVVDPTNRNRVYAAVTTAYGTIGNAGIYRSEDGGFNWTAAVTLYTGTTPVDFVTGLSSSLRILLAVGERTGTLFAMSSWTPSTLILPRLVNCMVYSSRQTMVMVCGHRWVNRHRPFSLAYKRSSTAPSRRIQRTRMSCSSAATDKWVHSQMSTAAQLSLPIRSAATPRCCLRTNGRTWWATAPTAPPRTQIAARWSSARTVTFWRAPTVEFICWTILISRPPVHGSRSTSISGVLSLLASPTTP